MIYFDNNATTRIAPAARDAMLPFLGEHFGNPSSVHAQGQAARHAVENARSAVAALLGARPREVVFTGGGTEADNLAILGALGMQPRKRHIVTTAVEHEAVLRLCQRLEQDGYRVTYLPVDTLGRLDPDEFAAALCDETAVASVMYANNETGVLFPVEQLAEIAAAHGVPLHIDAVQVAGKLRIDVAQMPVALLSISAHKMHGPKGVGALYVRRGMHLRSIMMGGHQERDLRPGTENVAAIVGFAAAVELAARVEPGERERVRRLRDGLERGIIERVPFAHINGDREQRTSNTTNIGFETLEAESVVIALSEAGVCVSAGAACASGSLEASHVLKAMRLPEAIAHGGIRFSLSSETTESEIDAALEIIPRVVTRLRALLPQTR